MEIVFGILMGMFALYVLVMCFVNMGKSIHSLFNQSRWSENANPDPDAIIVDMKSQQVKYVKNGAKFKTTVTFSDGFTFTTHKTNRVNHFGSYTISVDRKEVAQMAKDAHAKAVEKKLGKATPAEKAEARTVAQPAATPSVEPVPGPASNSFLIPPDPVEAFQPKDPVPPVDDGYPKTVPLKESKPQVDDYPTTAPVSQPKPPVDDYPTTAPVSQTKPDYPTTAPVSDHRPPVIITPVVPEAKPEPKPETTRWICPRCGLVHNKALAVCFHCGTEQTKANKFV